MKKKIIDRAKKILAISMCFILLVINLSMFLDFRTRKNDNISVSVSQVSENKEDIKTNDIRKIKVTSRGNYTRRVQTKYTVYNVLIEDEIVFSFYDIEEANTIKQEIENKTINIEVKIKEVVQYTKLKQLNTEEIKNKKNKIIEKYKKPETYYPTLTKYISSYYGNRSLGWHSGIDLAGNHNDPIYAYKSGKVIFAGYSGGYGNMVLIQHKDGMKTRYAHMSSIIVSKGDYVEGGQKVGLMGSTGRSTGDHLHFEVIINEKNVNPYGYIF